MTFCAPARDMLLSNHDTEKLNFDTYYIKKLLVNIKTVFLTGNIKMGEKRMRVHRKGPKFIQNFNCSVMLSYFLKASHLSSFVFKADSNNK